jgi:hypothetical protein
MTDGTGYYTKRINKNDRLTSGLDANLMRCIWQRPSTGMPLNISVNGPTAQLGTGLKSHLTVIVG